MLVLSCVLGGLIKSVNNRSLLEELGGCGVSVHPKYDPMRKTTIIHTYNLRVRLLQRNPLQ